MYEHFPAGNNAIAGVSPLFRESEMCKRAGHMVSAGLEEYKKNVKRRRTMEDAPLPAPRPPPAPETSDALRCRRNGAAERNKVCASESHRARFSRRGALRTLRSASLSTVRALTPPPPKKPRRAMRLLMPSVPAQLVKIPAQSTTSVCEI